MGKIHRRFTARNEEIHDFIVFLRLQVISQVERADLGYKEFQVVLPYLI
jgi:hypothetical protein